MQPFQDKNFIIRFFHVHKRYDGKNALIDITLDVHENEFLFITGPSGAGKTTLLKMLYLGEPVSEGQVIIDGMNLSRISRRRIPGLRRKFGIIFQDYKLIPTKNVYENIALVVEAVGTKKRLIRKKVNSVLRTVGMEGKEKIFPPGLSGGEQQRVAVARAIAGNPRVILADEPTGSLDTASAEGVFELLKGFHARGATMIVATHNKSLIRRTGGRVILLEQGRLKSSTIVPVPN